MHSDATFPMLHPTVETPAREESEGDDSDWPWPRHLKTDLPEGEYIVAYRGFKKGIVTVSQKYGWTLSPVEPGRLCAGIRISLFATIGRQCTQRSKYYGIWVKANGGLTPSPRSDVTQGLQRLLAGSHCLECPKNGGHPMPQVAELIERVAGGPAR